MGHRHLFGTSQMFESENEQGWNHMHTEQPHTNLGIVLLMPSLLPFIFKGDKVDLDDK